MATFCFQGRLARASTSRPNAGAHQKPREHGAGPQHALHVQLGDDHAGGAIRNEAHKRGREHREIRVVAEELGERVLPHRFQHDVQRNGDEEDEQRHLHRVLRGALQDALPTVPVLMGVLHVIVVLVGAFGSLLAGVTVVVAAALVLLAQLMDAQTLLDRGAPGAARHPR